MSDYQDRLHRVIPGGAHTYSRGDDQYPSNAPPILERGEGAYVWTPDGQKFLDYGMALRAVTLGYAHEEVDASAYAAIRKGVNLTRPSVVELEAAETLAALVPSVDMVKFAKNGSNVTTAAVKVARAHTGRRYVCVPRQQPFFSFDDWFIGTTPVTRGIPTGAAAGTLLFDYGDIGTLEALFVEHEGDIACVMLEPATTLGPCPPGCDAMHVRRTDAERMHGHGPTFLHRVQDLCARHGALFILDEMITGFRWDVRGAQAYFGVQPDLCTFGKGMANGFSVSALAGKREFMDVGGISEEGQERTFLISTTHGAEMPGLAAFSETVRVYERDDVVGHLWDYGQRLFDGLNAVSASHGLSDHFYMDGGAVSMNYVTKDSAGRSSLEFRTLFAQEMIRAGVLMPWIAVSFAHGDRELALTLDAADRALTTYASALTGSVANYLVGRPIRPVFRKFN